MKRLMIIALSVAAVALAVSATAGATSYNYTVYPGDLAGRAAFDNGRGGEKFGYDPDMPPPIGVFVPGPTGFGDSSWWSNVQGSAAGGPRDYTAFRMSPRDIFVGKTDVTIADLKSISYYTKWVSDLDWQIKIYTEDVTDPIEWYQTRIEWNRPSGQDGNWNQYTADGLKVGKLTVKDSGDQTIPGTGLLSDLDALYGTEKILFIDIIASYASSSPPSYSYLDGVQITLDDDSVATMDLATPVPEPGALSLLGLGLLGLVRRKRRS